MSAADFEERIRSLERQLRLHRRLGGLCTIGLLSAFLLGSLGEDGIVEAKVIRVRDESGTVRAALIPGQLMFTWPNGKVAAVLGTGDKPPHDSKFALQVYDQRGDEGPVRLYLGSDDESGSALRFNDKNNVIRTVVMQADELGGYVGVYDAEQKYTWGSR